jgi:hypothetical protein
MNRRHVQEGYDQVQQALLDYTVNCYPQIQVIYSSVCCTVHSVGGLHLSYYICTLEMILKGHHLMTTNCQVGLLLKGSGLYY